MKRKNNTFLKFRSWSKYTYTSGGNARQRRLSRRRIVKAYKDAGVYCELSKPSYVKTGIFYVIM